MSITRRKANPGLCVDLNPGSGRLSVRPVRTKDVVKTESQTHGRFGTWLEELLLTGVWKRGESSKMAGTPAERDWRKG